MDTWSALAKTVGNFVTHPGGSAAQVKLQRRQEELQSELEQCGEDMDKMAALLDEMEELNKNATDLDMTLLDRNIDKMMPELGFTPEDSDQLVAAYRFDSVAVAVSLLLLLCRCCCCCYLVSRQSLGWRCY